MYNLRRLFTLTIGNFTDYNNDYKTDNLGTLALVSSIKSLPSKKQKLQCDLPCNKEYSSLSLINV